MAYVHCMPARVMALQHGLDNIVTGTLRTPLGDLAFKTRGHIVKATNKIYRGCPWKPSAGEDVLFDAEINGSSAVVDHIERDLGPTVEKGAANPHLDTIRDLLPKHPPATKTLRVCRHGGPTRLRFAANASRRDPRGRIQDEIVHAMHDDGAWSIWTVTRDGGELSGKGIDAAVLPIIARAAGADLISGETERERSERIEREEIDADRAKRSAHAIEPPPFDDCPF